MTKDKLISVGTPRHNEVIYRRRRLAALVILLVVIALAIWAVVSMGGGSSEETETDNAAASLTLETSAVETTTEETTEESTSTPEDAAGSSVDAAGGTTEAAETTEPTEAPKNSCELSDLIITAGSNKPTFDPGEEPELYMTVENPTAADCDIDLNDNILRFEVYNLANNARVWSDVDCNPAVETGTRIFPAGEQRYFQAIWSRTTSAPEQCSNRQPVPAGSYFLHTVIGENPSQALTFNLG
ncbi:hypothetical protein CFAEC_11630 [Corynebacterium faecale]|uniref:hypothetical protein n=1 Tax=Corynebacterium faecale TaxID=1758466 RepID=UPI0025B5164B|nr:hypothetical protein [Corynebacterium faecale]WJY93118.1 hypothetical protein CFAEC_11630 [Corynebacterium faecale]